MENYSLKIIHNIHNVSCGIMIMALLVVLGAFIAYFIFKCDEASGYNTDGNMKVTKSILLISCITSIISILAYIFTY